MKTCIFTKGRLISFWTIQEKKLNSSLENNRKYTKQTKMKNLTNWTFIKTKGINILVFKVKFQAKKILKTMKKLCSLKFLIPFKKIKTANQISEVENKPQHSKTTKAKKQKTKEQTLSKLIQKMMQL
jgi:hypothetical protein